ncbi:hypothetical protein CAPTEDRAFT_214032 [Capitella teleta]|uniref:C-type lectin domain-containing protein n=1 Tax=Capitella teleta TaxID=283909 RepID=R7TSQ7_CAPTE|nr:hypothetical protein CAPTEDRAFT_214032 [Capitella teleta]|eukprot:ELT94060.1 hypothetical protein CAPTEDRAFT_214032 [Capitella teleta]
MNIFFALTITLCAEFIIGEFTGTCDLTWESPEGILKSCYKFHNEQKKVSEARSACESEGMRLLALETMAEIELITRHIEPVSSRHSSWQTVDHGDRNMTFDPTVPAWWTGGHGNLNEDNWVWTPGNTPIVDGWYSGGPSSLTGRSEKCVALKNGALHDLKCSVLYPFICESRVPAISYPL